MIDIVEVSLTYIVCNSEKTCVYFELYLMNKIKEKPTRRRSRTVSWDHSVGIENELFTRSLSDRSSQLSQEPPSSSGLRDLLTNDIFEDNMSISRGHSIEKVRFSTSRTHSDENEEDYTTSFNAILHKRLNSRKCRYPKQRRSSSPISPMLPDDVSLLSDRRRSSAFTTSSGDTAIIIEETNISQEQIFENISLHKEVLISVRQQPWSIRRKIKMVQQAKEYVKKHEGQLQERLAMSKSTRDMLARFHILIVKQWQHSKREMSNFISILIPWELTIKEIESQFGTVVASYFTFLRWLFWVNFVISVFLAAFVIIPEVLTTNADNTGERKTLLPEEDIKSIELSTLINVEGVFLQSPLFYGYYSNRQNLDIGYQLPTAYFIVGLVVYIYSFVATLRKMAANSRLSKLSEKDDECVFSWKLFTGWDYMIGNEETALNRISSIILGFKEALLEEAERMKDNRNWKVMALRVFANLNMIWMLGSSSYAVMWAVARSMEPDAESTLWRKNEITVVTNLISNVFPMAFEGLGVLENYHPRTTLRLQLARIMALYLLNLYTLTIALFGKIDKMTKDLLKLKPNVTDITSSMTILTKMSNSSLLIPLSLLNPATLNTASSINGASNSMICNRIIIECPFSLTTTHSFNNHTNLVDLKSSFNTTSSTTVIIEPIDSSINPIKYVQIKNYTSNSLTTIAHEVNKVTTNLSKSFNFTQSPITTEESFYETINEINITANIYYSSSTEDTGIAETDNLFKNEPFENTTTLDYTSTWESDDYKETDIVVDMYNEQYDENIENNTQILNRKKRTSTVLFNGTHCFQDNCQISPHFTESFSNQNDLFEKNKNEDAPREDLSLQATCFDLTTRRNLRKLCWETMFGQELVKLTVLDLVSTIFTTIFVDFMRAVFVRYMNRCWCWNLEKRFPQYGEFKIAENILHLVNNQGMVWMGMFFSPGLPIINVIKLMIMMYVRSWAVLTCNIPHDVVFRASRSNNFYLGLLLTMLFLCVLPVSYAIVWIEPSWHCGPFSQYKKIYHIFTNTIKKAVQKPTMHLVFDYIASPALVIPMLLLLILIIYYLASLTSSLREANNDLKLQLRRERTEERRKMYQLVTSKKLGENDFNNMDLALTKWRQIIPDTKRSLAKGIKEKIGTHNDITTLDKVREKIVKVEANYQSIKINENEDSNFRKANTHHRQHFRHKNYARQNQNLINEDSKNSKIINKWNKPHVNSKFSASDSDSTDYSESVPEIRVKTASMDELVTITESTLPTTLRKNMDVLFVPSSPPPAGDSGGIITVIYDKQNVVEPITEINKNNSHFPNKINIKQNAKLKIADILYKEAKRRMQNYSKESKSEP
ncbi:transmembrane channel-like protein isoform X2 [Daktulosphaira vitifoliae]|uniref:transmembrane channel-like protein isoform X2 n=1 Tax=Daktulosphaira vitifoliae TaxID=58002 RepID=UPI0021AA0D86|nr:transmembrane channel-like protein isoform X2 [Daktulosphaira vitifoliae]